MPEILNIRITVQDQGDIDAFARQNGWEGVGDSKQFSVDVIRELFRQQTITNLIDKQRDDGPGAIRARVERDVIVESDPA